MRSLIETIDPVVLPRNEPAGVTYKCQKCKDEGFTFSMVDGYEQAKECECQVLIRIERYLKSSGVDYEEYSAKTLNSFKTDNDMATQMKDYAIRFLADPHAKGIGYFGKSGIGKTHICIAICQELTKKRLIPHLYFSYRSEIQRLKAEFYHEEAYAALMNRWISCRVLYIDDLFKFSTGRDGQIQSQDLQIMFDLINSRYLNKSMTIFSSEYSVNDIKRIDEALGSRIFSMVHPYGLKCEGENRRFTDAKS